MTVDVRTVDSQSVGTVAQTTGRVSGSRYMSLDEGRYVLAVDSDDTWSVRYSAPEYETGDPLPVSYDGQGTTAATPPFRHTGGRLTVDYRHDGGALTLEVLHADTGEVAATVADTSAEGTSAANNMTTEEQLAGLDEGVYVLNVEADTAWSVEVR